MEFGNALALGSRPIRLQGRLLLDGELRAGTLVLESGRIAAVELGQPSQAGPILAPGLIDLQLNGAFGIDIATTPEQLPELAMRLASVGVTSFLPTVISSSREVYERLESAWRRLAFRQGGEPIDHIEHGRLASGGARVLGLHLEGPYLSSRRAGVHPIGPISEAESALPTSMLARWLDDLRVGGANGPSALRLMTLAPERPGALELVRRLRGGGAVVSVGHTDATYDELRAGIDAGASMVTHLFNAMSPLHHRAPGAVGAALDDPRVVTGLIADGAHVHDAALRLAFRAKGREGIALVSDAIAGAEPGSSLEAPPPPERLAGSQLLLDGAVARFAKIVGDPAAALQAATATPSRLLGRPALGTLEVGATADLALFDDELALWATVIAGEVVYRRAT